MNLCKVSVILLVSVIGVTGCATSNSGSSTSQSPNPTAPVAVKIPASSPFAKIKVGMSQKQVHDLIGQPTDQKTYTTGKMFIPFYFGDDMSRFEESYKGMGKITFTGAGIGGVNWKVYNISYDPNETGYQ